MEEPRRNESRRNANGANGSLTYENAVRLAKYNDGVTNPDTALEMALEVSRNFNNNRDRNTKKRPREEDAAGSADPGLERALKQIKKMEEDEEASRRKHEVSKPSISERQKPSISERHSFAEMHFFPRGPVAASTLTITTAADWNPARETVPTLFQYRDGWNKLGFGTEHPMTHQSKAVEESKLHPDKRIGLLICGNSGLPAGHLGHGVTEVKAYATQEEDIMMGVVLAETDCTNWKKRGDKITQMDRFVRDHLAGRWGLKDRSGTFTVQGVNYVECINPAMYGSAWSLRDCRIVGKNKMGKDGKFELDNVSNPNICLTFVAGPNAGASGTPGGTTARTLNRFCETRTKKPTQAGYDFLEAGTQAAIRAGLLSMIENGCLIALLSGVSSGIYAGQYKDLPNHVYNWPKTQDLVQKVLNEDVPGRPGVKIGQCFIRVYV